MALAWKEEFVEKWCESVQFAGGGVCVEWGVETISLPDGAQADSASSTHNNSGRHLRTVCMVFVTS